LGNVPGHEGNHTYCHGCRELLIERKGYVVSPRGLANGRCRACNAPIPGRWQQA
jgi:pyruvate formate lyase activating enzyme